MAAETAPAATISGVSIPSSASASIDEETEVVDGAKDGADSQLDGVVVDGRVNISRRETSASTHEARSNDFPRNDDAIAGHTTTADDDSTVADAAHDEERLMLGEVKRCCFDRLRVSLRRVMLKRYTVGSIVQPIRIKWPASTQRNIVRAGQHKPNEAMSVPPALSKANDIRTGVRRIIM